MTNKLLDSAMTWLDRGIAPIPCRPASKWAAVKWLKYQQELPSESQVRRWFNNGDKNLAVVCGGPAGLVILDFDTMESYDDFRSNWHHLSESFTVATARGRHVYFIVNGHVDTRMNLDGCDLKSTGGYCLTSPSVHPSGTRYRVVKDAPIMEVSVDRIGKIVAQYGGVLDAPCVPAPAQVSLAHPYTEHPLALPTRPPKRLSVNEIKRQISILELASRFTRPISSSPGGRWWIARCPHPSHTDEHPSFWIDNRRNLAGCYTPKCKRSQPGQGRAMDQINLYGWLHGLSNSQSIAQLSIELS